MASDDERLHASASLNLSHGEQALSLHAEILSLQAQCATLQEKLDEKDSRLRQAEVEIRSQANEIKELSLLSVLNDSLKEQLSGLKEKISKSERDEVGTLDPLKSQEIPENSMVINHHKLSEVSSRHSNSDHDYDTYEGKYMPSSEIFSNKKMKMSLRESVRHKDTSMKSWLSMGSTSFRVKPGYIQ